jgi:CMP-N-acetylneuraminic acid synthetase
MTAARKTVFAHITMRGGGSTFYRKNLYRLYGKPVLQHALELCLHAGFVDEIFVWTEDEEAKEVARIVGAHPLNRPRSMVHYFNGFHGVPEWNENRCRQAEAIAGGTGDIQLNLNCNNFLVKPETLRAMFKRLVEEPEAMRITAMRQIAPGLCMVNPNNGYLMPFWNDIHTAEAEHPPLYRMVGASIADAVRQGQGKTRGLYQEVSVEEGFDFQTEEDVPLAEFYLGRRMSAAGEAK